jgi:uncharacterized protein YaaR (DUF327 family)
MDKIESLGDGFSLRKRARKGTPGKRALSFSGIVEESSGESELGGEPEYRYQPDDLAEALELIREEGEALKSAPTMENVKRYRGSVKAFLQTVLEKILKTEERISGINPMRKKRYVLIKVIDRKLEQLALDVLKHQSDQLKILERVEEINGLIVDLVT